MMKLRHSALSIAAGPVWLEAMQAPAPDAPGDYSLSIYFNGLAITVITFTVTE